MLTSILTHSQDSENLLKNDSSHLVKGKIIKIESRGRYALKVTIVDSSEKKILLMCDTKEITAFNWSELKKDTSLAAYGKYFEMEKVIYLSPSKLKIIHK